jgi:hypothetical protein
MLRLLNGLCPVCAEQLEATRLYCRHCGTSIEGYFSLMRLGRLNAEQLAFVETFVRCEGRLNRVGEELGISYPTVRNRLGEVLRALGHSVDERLYPSTAQRLRILEQLSEGVISSEEAVRLLRTGELGI